MNNAIKPTLGRDCWLWNLKLIEIKLQMWLWAVVSYFMSYMDQQASHTHNYKLEAIDQGHELATLMSHVFLLLSLLFGIIHFILSWFSSKWSKVWKKSLVRVPIFTWISSHELPRSQSPIILFVDVLSVVASFDPCTQSLFFFWLQSVHNRC